MFLKTKKSRKIVQAKESPADKLELKKSKAAALAARVNKENKKEKADWQSDGGRN